jgi:ribosomal protein S18 acetylase RimI-like enzyme
MVLKRVPMVLQMARHPLATPQWPSRTIRDTDAEDLALLLYAAFHGTIDDAGETFADARSEIERTFAGGYGRLLPDCSFAIQQGEFLASACLTSWYEPVSSPFVVFTMTRPEHKHQGMARFLLKQSINALVDRGYARLALIVTEGNVPAQSLYASVGFRKMSVE